MPLAGDREMGAIESRCIVNTSAPSGLRCPNFLYIGPDKSASSWLFETLREHPDCYVTTDRHIGFFDRHFDKGLAWYLVNFSKAPTEAKAIGEVYHDYLFSPVAAERIRRTLPGVKLLTCLRDPVDRAFSSYLFMIRCGLTDQPFEVVLKQYPKLIERGLYHKHLSEYFSRFDRDQIKVLFFDRLVADSLEFGRELFAFLDLPFLQTIDYSKRERPASRPRNALLARLAYNGAEFARSIGVGRLVWLIQQTRLFPMLYEPYSKDSKPRLDPSVRAELRKVFTPDLMKLQVLLETDLGSWMH